MAKSNTWQQKLMHKAKVYALKQKLGNEKGVMSYCARTHSFGARPLDLEDIQDKPVPVGPRERDLKPLPKKPFKRFAKAIDAKDTRGFCQVSRDDELNAQVRALINVAPSRAKPYVAMSKAELRKLAGVHN